jgi:2-oxoglutarate dehydrogenase complex dehydrogenase (E1) component-like enzyme
MGSKQPLFYAGRRGAAAPATGIGAIHTEEQARLVAAAIEFIPAATPTSAPAKASRK